MIYDIFGAWGFLVRDQILEGITLVKPTIIFAVPILMNKV